MLNKVFGVSKSYIQFSIVRALLFFAIFIGLGLFTFFMAAIMYLDWHWKLCCIFAVCMAPWLLAIIVLAILTIRYHIRFKRRKNAFFIFNSQGIVSKALSLVSGYFFR